MSKVKSAEPLKWFFMTAFFAATSTWSISQQQWLVAGICLFCLAGTGGELAIQNAKWRLERGKDL